MSGQWDQMFAKIQASIEESEKKSQAKVEVEADDVQVPEKFLEAAPEVFEENTYASRKAEQQAEEDSALAKLNIVSVYRKLTGNQKKLPNGGTGNLLIFCPASDHNNVNDEAAWLEKDKNIWVCAVCDKGGGIIDMVAAANGLEWGKTAKGKDFAKAKQLTLEQFCGWTFEKTKAGFVGKSPEAKKREVEEFRAQYGELPEADEEDSTEESHQSAVKPLGIDYAPGDEDLPSIGPTKFNKKEFVAQSTAPTEPKPQPTPTSETKPTSLVAKPASSGGQPKLKVVQSGSSEESPDAQPADKLPEIEGIFDRIPEGTPLHEFMKATCEMKSPNEFLLFRGLQLLALSAGPFTRGMIGDYYKLTISPLFVGDSGAGKSASKKALMKVLKHIVYSWRPAPPVGSKYGKAEGVRILDTPGSAEAMLDELSKEESEGVPYPIRDVMGFLDVDELSNFMGKSSNNGSTLREKFMELENSGELDYVVSAISRSGGRTRAINANLVFSTGVQPAAVGAVLGRHHVGNGFLARFEVVTGNKIYGYDPFKNGMKDMDYCTELYTDLAVYYLNKVDPERKGVRNLFVIEVEPESRSYMKQCHDEVERWGMGDDAKNRFDLKLFKLSALFAVNRKADLIIREDIDCAMWIMEYLNRSTTLTGERATTVQGGEIEELALKAAKYWTEKRGYVTMGNMTARVDAKRHGWDPAEVFRRIEMLVDRGELVVDPDDKAARGPKATRYIHADAATARQLRSKSQAKKRKSQ